MAKIKTHKASAKRFSLTGGGKIKHNASQHRHKLGIKTTKRKRNMRKASYLSPSMAPTIKTLIQK